MIRHPPCSPMAQGRLKTAALALALAGLLTPSLRAGPLVEVESLRMLSLEELLDVEVVTASRHGKSWFDTPAAVHVLTAEDIRRSGASNLPELLRQVPGVHVARIDAHTWALSARGFADKYADKMLVLIDGRSVYTPLFSGVHWDSVDLLLEDVERIEVVRGPGGAVWGSNAVNAVINIITKEASRTTGSLVRFELGTRRELAARHGGRLGAKGHYRVWAKHHERDGLWRPDGSPAHDDWSATRAGLRFDWNLSPRDSLSFMAEMGSGRFAFEDMELSPQAPHEKVRSGHGSFDQAHVLVRWERELSARTELSLQFWADRNARVSSAWSDVLHQQDLELDLHTRFASGHSIAWGVGLRRSADHFDGSFQVAMDEDRKVLTTAQAYLQAELALTEALRLTLGTKVEVSNRLSPQVQPTLRLGWMARPNLHLWAAVSGASRSPSRLDHDARLVVGVAADGPGGLPLVPRVRRGDDHPRAESLLSWEAGMRWRPTSRFSLELDAFWNEYGRLRSLEELEPRLAEEGGAPFIEVPYQMGDEADARALGLEMLAMWRPIDRVELRLAWSYLDLDFRTPAGFEDVLSDRDIGRGHSPRHRLHLGTRVDLPGGWELDIDAEQVLSWNAAPLPSRLRLDLRARWRKGEHFELAFGLRDALGGRHREFGGYSLDSPISEVGRSWHVSAGWRF